MTLLERFVERIDAMRGRGAAALANGMARSAGRFWLRVGGGVNLYRGPADGDIDYSRPIGVAGPFASLHGEIRSLPGVAFEAETDYDLVCRAVGCGGVEEFSENRVRIRFDDAAETVGARPNRPAGLCAQAVAGGAILLSWRGVSAGAAARAASYHVYHNGGAGEVDYDTLIDEVPARGDAWHAWQSEPFADGTTVTFGVRAANAGGTEEQNTNTAVATADAVAPDAVQGIRLIEVTER